MEEPLQDPTSALNMNTAFPLTSNALAFLESDPTNPIDIANCHAELGKVAASLNSHQALVGALELAEATIERLSPQHGPFNSADGTLSVIRAALVLATGGNK